MRAIEIAGDIPGVFPVQCGLHPRCNMVANPAHSRDLIIRYKTQVVEGVRIVDPERSFYIRRVKPLPTLSATLIVKNAGRPYG